MKLCVLYFLFVFALCSCQEKKQNIIVILVDDLGWADLGYSGSSFYETPNIDALSKESIKLTNAYAAASICSPTRAAILTGKHPARLGITDWIPGFIPKTPEKLVSPDIPEELALKEVTLAEAFKANGYKTCFVGKWHLGDKGFYPENQGFDINLGGHHKGSPPGGYYTPYKNPKLSDGPKGEYLTDRLTNESINFITSVKDSPFLLYISYYTVHTPIEANRTYVEKFQKKTKDKESYHIEGRGLTTLTQQNANYASMVYALDKNVGNLIETLKTQGLYNNTTIVFTSDNGGLSTVLNTGKREGPTANSPLRAGKGWLYEGGIRVPMLIKPAHYNSMDKVIDTPVISQDIYPTLLSLANLSPQPNTIFDGIDLSPALIENKVLQRNTLFWHYPHYHGSGWTPGAAIRQKDWKLIEFYDSETIELYHLKNDISESQNLALKYPKKVIALQNQLHKFQDSIGAKFPTKNPSYSSNK